MQGTRAEKNSFNSDIVAIGLKTHNVVSIQHVTKNDPISQRHDVVQQCDKVERRFKKENKKLREDLDQLKKDLRDKDEENELLTAKAKRNKDKNKEVKKLLAAAHAAQHVEVQ